MFHKLLNVIKNWGQGNLPPKIICPLCYNEINDDNKVFLPIDGGSAIGPLYQTCDDKFIITTK